MRQAYAIAFFSVVGVAGCEPKDKPVKEERLSQATLDRNSSLNCETEFKDYRYIKLTASGWRKAIFEDNGAEVSLPKFLKVETYRICNGNEYFTIREGVYKGKKAHMYVGNLEIDGSDVHTGPALLKYNRSRNEFSYKDNDREIVCKTVDPNDSAGPNQFYDMKVPAGTWEINIPDFPHGTADEYKQYTRLATVWFRIASESKDGARNRYIHVGKFSKGCITIIPKSKNIDWDSACLALMKARLNDSSVGTLEVID